MCSRTSWHRALAKDRPHDAKNGADLHLEKVAVYIQKVGRLPQLVERVLNGSINERYQLVDIIPSEEFLSSWKFGLLRRFPEITRQVLGVS